MRIFINGQEDPAPTYLNPGVTEGDPCAGVHPLTIGGRYTPEPAQGEPSVGPDALVNGGIDEVRIFSRALSGEAIRFYLGDAYIRDNLLDDGTEPMSAGILSRSPGINHYSHELADPESVLASPAAIDRDDLFEDIEIGQPNHIYVRLQNRGLVPVEAEVTSIGRVPRPFSRQPAGIV